MYKKMLLAYDGTRDGRTALIEGAEFAQACHAEVLLLAVVDVTGIDAAAASGYASGGCANNEVEQFQQVLDEGLERLKKRGLAATTLLDFGSPAERIATIAHDIAADLVVIGHRPHGGWTLWRQQPVGDYLLRNLSCSLLVVHAKSEGAPAR